MRFFRGVIFLLLTACAVGGSELPEIVARCGEMSVRRDEVAQLLKQASPEDTARLPRRELLKKVLTDHFCSEVLSKMLTEAGFPPNAETALAMLKSSRSDLSSGTRRLDDGTLKRLAGEPKVQLQWAFRKYLQERRPDIFRVPPAVIERYYRENQQEFLLPPQVSGARYTAKDEAALNAFLLRVRQGEDPASAAAGESGISAETLAGDHPGLAGLRKGEWSRIMVIPGSGCAVYHVVAVKPASYVPLEKAAPLIRELMARHRAALELERTLKTVFDTAKMEFYF